MLDAWERVGREDFKRQAAPRFHLAATKTMTPLGLACLMRYARGFDDEAQARAVALATPHHD
jgi:hypothetical protein